MLLGVTQHLSFPRSAWECSPDAVRPSVKGSQQDVATRSVATRIATA